MFVSSTSGGRGGTGLAGTLLMATQLEEINSQPALAAAERQLRLHMLSKDPPPRQAERAANASDVHKHTGA